MGRCAPEWIPAYAGMTVMGRCAPEWIPAYAGMTAIGRCAPEWIPAYAGMTVMAGAVRNLPPSARRRAVRPRLVREGEAERAQPRDLERHPYLMHAGR